MVFERVELHDTRGTHWTSTFLGVLAAICGV